MLDDQAFRNALAAVCTPVAVVTSISEGRPHGTTVSAFCSLSLHPPLVLVSLDRRSALLDMVSVTRAYGINVLEHHQQALATAFARKGADGFAVADWRLDDGLPRLAGVGSWLACSLRQLVDGGDHVILIAEVTRADHDAHQPLLYQQRTFGTLAPPNPQSCA
jgi:flavin reductase (DIM6/NTAB) family NADH-FMN oxidoreductase RutF